MSTSNSRVDPEQARMTTHKWVVQHIHQMQLYLGRSAIPQQTDTWLEIPRITSERSLIILSLPLEEATLSV